MDQTLPRRVTRASIIIGLAALFAVTIFLLPPLKTAVPVVQAQVVPQVAFSSASLDLNENVGTVDVTVSLSAVTTNTVRVSYNSFAGTATGGGIDYISVSGLLTFQPNVQTQTIAITIIDDTIDEPTEFFYIELLNPQNATLGIPSRIQINILDNDEPPAATATPGGIILLDGYEPNNSFREAFTAAVGNRLCNATLWPVGDLDYYQFFVKSGSRYRINTQELANGIDTVLTVFDAQGNQLAQNDDFGVVGSRASQVEITASADAFYYALIENKDPSDPTNKTYCFQAAEIAQPTPTPSQTPIGEGDDCEFNSTLQTACVIGLGQTYNMDFVPTLGSSQDTDYFRLWMKAGVTYTCETLNLSAYADTNMIFLDQNGNDFFPNLGNDDRELGDRSSRLSILAPYTGYLSIVVGPVNPPPYDESPLHTYQLLCNQSVPTPTPTATATSTPAPPTTGGPGTGGPVAATPTPFQVTVFPTVTPIDFTSIFQTLTPAPPPGVQIQPLPTATPSTAGQRLVNVNVTLFYDSNNNFIPDATEGILDAAVALYENSSGQLLAFGYTNEAGSIRFDSIVATGALRVVVPFLNYSQVVSGEESNILVRVAPQPLPAGIP